MINRRKFISLIGLAILAACGGGGGGSSHLTPFPPPYPPLPAVLRSDAYVGYYAGTNGTAVEVANHVNIFMTIGDGPADFLTNTITQLIEAVNAGIENLIVFVPHPYVFQANPEVGKSDLRTWFNAFKAAGLLPHIKYLYPIDEPNKPFDGTPPKTEAEVVVANALLRSVVAEYPELSGVKLAVIYAKAGTFPGIHTYDAIAIDDYDSGNGILSQYDLWIRDPELVTKEFFLVPGGSDDAQPTRTDPEIFVSYLENNLRIKMLLAFTWFDRAGIKGIRSNGRACAFKIAMKKIRNPNVPSPTCA